MAQGVKKRRPRKRLKVVDGEKDRAGKEKCPKCTIGSILSAEEQIVIPRQRKQLILDQEETTVVCWCLKVYH